LDAGKGVLVAEPKGLFLPHFSCHPTRWRAIERAAGRSLKIKSRLLSLGLLAVGESLPQNNPAFDGAKLTDLHGSPGTSVEVPVSL